jgi:hypothetical protein
LFEEDGTDELVDVGRVREGGKLGRDGVVLGKLGFEGLAGGDAGLEVWKAMSEGLEERGTYSTERLLAR